MWFLDPCSRGLSISVSYCQCLPAPASVFSALMSKINLVQVASCKLLAQVGKLQVVSSSWQGGKLQVVCNWWNRGPWAQLVIFNLTLSSSDVWHVPVWQIVTSHRPIDKNLRFSRDHAMDAPKLTFVWTTEIITPTSSYLLLDQGLNIQTTSRVEKPFYLNLYCFLIKSSVVLLGGEFWALLSTFLHF